MKLIRKAPAAPSIQLVRWGDRFVIDGGWVFQEALVRLPDGSTDVYEIPLRALGGGA